MATGHSEHSDHRGEPERLSQVRKLELGEARVPRYGYSSLPEIPVWLMWWMDEVNELGGQLPSQVNVDGRSASRTSSIGPIGDWPDEPDDSAMDCAAL